MPHLDQKGARRESEKGAINKKPKEKISLP